MMNNYNKYELNKKYYKSLYINLDGGYKKKEI